jgi:hypothetical protein
VAATTVVVVKSESGGSVYQRIKKRPISGVMNSDVDSEFTCPICFDMIDAAHVTKCGHSFCQVCIQTALEHTHRCPKCNTPCSIQKDVFPNFTCLWTTCDFFILGLLFLCNFLVI